MKRNRNRIIAWILTLAMLAGMIPATTVTASAEPILTTDFAPHKCVIGDVVNAVNVNREANMLVKYEYGFDFKNT